MSQPAEQTATLRTSRNATPIKQPGSSFSCAETDQVRRGVGSPGPCGPDAPSAWEVCLRGRRPPLYQPS
jgi:hypothetical protein